jgi:hypothetical protein
MSNEPDEDLIEATIRRVAAAKAARLPEAAEEPRATPDDDSVSALDPHLAQEANEAPQKAPPSQRPAADESLIEATLRRIEAQQAQRAAEAAADESPLYKRAPEGESSPDLGPARSEDDGQAESAAPPADAARPTHLNIDIAPERKPADSPPGGPAWSDVAALRRDLDDTRRQLRELSERVDSMLAATPERAPLSNHQPAPAQSAAVSLSSRNSDDAWDDAPVITRLDTGLPPRPAIIRDPSPAPAPAERIEVPKSAGPAVSEVRPIPAPRHVGDAPKRGFDLLPRTYRITVEDKRRGVDLVPLHRALLGMDGVRDMSLLSYSNGTAIVALETTTDISPDALGAAVSHAMAREVKVEVHNEQTMVIKLAED